MNQNMPVMDADGAREDSRDRTKRKRETNIQFYANCFPIWNNMKLIMVLMI